VCVSLTPTACRLYIDWCVLVGVIVVDVIDDMLLLLLMLLMLLLLAAGYFPDFFLRFGAFACTPACLLKGCVLPGWLG
jgi:hypothetical protein